MSRRLYDDENVCPVDGTDLYINYRYLARRIISLERNLDNYAISIHESVYVNVRRCQSTLAIAITDTDIIDDLLATTVITFIQDFHRKNLAFKFQGPQYFFKYKIYIDSFY